jgi:Fe-S-cluster containining protein
MSYSEILLLADEARRFIGDFCYTECHAYCCRKGYLILKPDEVVHVVQKNKDVLIAKGSLRKLDNGNYSLFLGAHDCPSLRDYKCLIHQNSKRPDACRQFPIFLQDYRIRLSSRCLAVKMNKLYPYITAMIKLGCTLDKNNFQDIGYEDFFELHKKGNCISP